uniref:Replication protein VP4 n=1 Tax=Gokushovirinae environmental samples TaxID=1478972 RepID=A0A2R3UAH4_9VIRU|nr:replication protein VP4 [Gokushovirinae environmental samples]
MGCAQPLIAYRSKEIGPSGKRGITFNRNASFSGISFEVPCGQCIGCRLEHSRQWAMRCMHEKQMHANNVFVTLTYDDKNLPFGGTLVRKDPQLFLKRLRFEYGKGIRFYGCGEYGELSRRPHYHFILFNYAAADKKFYKRTKSGENLFTSPSLERLWPFGFNVVGDVSFKSCAYVARYVTGKIKGDNAEEHYSTVTTDGEIVNLLPEFSMMSRRPGIGSDWFKKFGAHVYEWDSVIMNGKEVRPPRFYDTRFEVVDSDRLAVVKSKRRRAAVLNKADNTTARRIVKEQVSRLNLLKREF